MEEKTFKISSISCGHCSNTIERELKKTEGVKKVTADPNTKMVTVKWDAPATWEVIEALLTETGYPPDK